MKKAQGGFTLIELVMVIVILGILAAVALPKFVDLRDQAATAAIEGAAGGLTSAAAVNYAAAMARNTGSYAVSGSGSAGVAAVIANMAGWDSTKFVISSVDLSCGTTVGKAIHATLSHAGGTSANSAVATIICTG